MSRRQDILVTKKEKDEAIACRKGMYKHAESEKCQAWQDVYTRLQADGYPEKMIREMFTWFRKKELNEICDMCYKRIY